jgi:ATP-dependent Clp protease ATP-binding subunit ClpA
MFERFTHQARRVVTLAQQEARALHHGYVGTEHILLGLLAEGQGIGAQVLSEQGSTLESARAGVEKLVGRGTVPREPDAEALESIGIDLAAVRRKVEEAFGPGALDRRHTGCRRERRFGYIPFTPRAKKVMELSLRAALRLRHRYIGTEHILLALLDEGEGLAARLLADAGVDFDAARRSVLEHLGRDAQFG